MREIIMGMLKFLLIVFSLLLLPMSLILASPVILLWPKSSRELSWSQVVKTRYGRLIKKAWELAQRGIELAGE